MDKVRKTLTAGLLLLVVLGLAGCGPAKVKQAKIKETVVVPMGTDLKPVQLKKVIIKLPRGKKVGKYSAGVACIEHGDLKWKSGKLNVSSDDLTEVFYEEFKKAEYEIVGNPDSLFEDPSAWKSEFLIGGMIKEMEANICYPMGGFGDWDSSKGGVYMKIQWQVYSNLDRKIVYTVTTEGSYEEHEDTSEDLVSLFNNAFGLATQNLLADHDFYDLVAGKRVAYESKTFNKTSINGVKTFVSDISDHINDVRAAVATVRVGQGHGSGFFISNDGYLLTNQHVAGDEGTTVKVLLSGGREVLGSVVKSDARRDIALIKTEPIKSQALPVRGSDPAVGDEVMAIGSPLEENLSTTISKGIISAFRVEDNLRFIQSDVNVMPGNSGGPLVDGNGNVIGLTVSGRLFGGTMAGLNMFIPIKDALDVLNIEMLPNSKLSSL